MVTHADFILVVEKDATFQKLLDAKFCEKLHPCILITVSKIFTCYAKIPVD